MRWLVLITLFSVSCRYESPRFTCEKKSPEDREGGYRECVKALHYSDSPKLFDIEYSYCFRMDNHMEYTCTPTLIECEEWSKHTNGSFCIRVTPEQL